MMDTKSISQEEVDKMMLRIKRMIWRLFSSPDVPKSLTKPQENKK